MSKFYKTWRTFRSLFFYFPCFFLILVPTAIHAQCPGTAVGYNNPAVGINDASTGSEAWNNPQNALTDNNSYATMSNAALLIGGTTRNSNFLILRNLGFSLPSNAIICGVQVEVRKFCSDNSTSNYTRDLDIRLLKNNAVVGTNHASTAANWPTSETAFTYGTNSDTWGATLTGFDVSNNGFGVAISIQSRAAGLLLPTVISYIDAVRLRIYYYVPFSDIDGDGVADENDGDIDGDGLPNNQELSICASPASLTLAAVADPSLAPVSAAGVSMAISNTATTGAGVSEFLIAENYPAVSGPEIKVTQDVVSATDNSTVLLKFNSPVHNLSFKLQDIDLAPGQFRDNVQVNVYANSQVYNLTAANYTIGTGAFNAFIGNNTFEGLVSMNDNELNGTISINIPGLVDSVRIILSNTDAGLGLQSIGIGQISYCNPNSAAQDFDGDGKPDFRDVDSDNDGIPDLREIQATVGFIAPAGTDSDGDGIDDAFDVSTGGVALTPVDSDGDGIPDYKDPDSDNDGNSDRVEGNDADHNCVADFALSNLDTDGDGLDDSYDPDSGGTPAPMQDTDGNGIPDYRQNTVPATSNAGPDQGGNNVAFNLAANTPGSGRGYWTVISGAGTFSNINSSTSSVTNLNGGTNIFAWTIYTDGCHSTTDQVVINQLLPLPVVMGAFTVTNDGGTALLKWNTFTEQNNLGFGILHSTDGLNWRQLEFVASLAQSGNSSSLLNYTAHHLQPANGKNYYRLQQKDKDGASKFSNIQTLVFAKQSGLVVHPNPVVNKIFLSGADAQNIQTLRLSDATGKILYVSNKATVSVVDMSIYSQDIYFLQVVYKDGSQKSSRIIKL